jgi:hypothetical protein
LNGIPGHKGNPLIPESPDFSWRNVQIFCQYREELSDNF